MSDLAEHLAQICEPDPPEVVLSGTPSDHRTEALIALDALVPVGTRQYLTCFACDEPHEVSVDPLGGSRYQAVCPDAGLLDVDARWLTRYAPDFAWITRNIAHGLDGPTSAFPSASPSTRLLRVGRCQIKKQPFLVYFARHQHQREVWEATLKIVRRAQGDLPAILVSTTPMQLLPAARPSIELVSLDEVLDLNGCVPAINRGPFLDALHGGAASVERKGLGFFASPGYRTVSWRGENFCFSPKQALVIETLFGKSILGPPGMHQSELQGAADTSQTVSQMFRRHPAYGSMIQYDGLGHYLVTE